MTDDFPEDVRRFIGDSIDSVQQLEILLFLRNDPNRSWSADEVGQSLYISPQPAELRLLGLKARNLLAASGTPSVYRYAPQTAELDAVVARLADLYRERRVTVITLIYSRPLPAQAFADAFRLRKGP